MSSTRDPKITNVKQMQAAMEAAQNYAADIASAAAAAIEEVTPFTVNVTIATGSWVTNTDTTTANAGYAYMANVSISGITANQTADVTLSAGSLAVAKAAGMAPICETYAGGIRFYSTAVASANITGTAQLKENQT